MYVGTGTFPRKDARMRIGSRPQTITPEGWIWYAIRAGALGLLLAGAALAFEDHDSEEVHSRISRILLSRRDALEGGRHLPRGR